MGYSSKNTGQHLENVVQNALLKGNNEEYTPVNDFDPATKKYVDDKIGQGGGSSSGDGGSYVEVNHGSNDTTFTLTPNVFHVWDEVASLDLSLAEEQAGVANEYLFQFTSGSTATTLTLPDSIKWANDVAPTIAENMIYQISVLKGLASVLEFNNLRLIENRLSIINKDATQSTFVFDFPVASDITITYTNQFGFSSDIVIPKGETTVDTMQEPGNGNISSVTISPESDETYIYMR